ncbi:MAG: hypothetical protein QM687_09765 [Ferruginibacter sp.]
MRFRKTTLIAAALFTYVHAGAQVTAEQRIQDSVIGWWSNPYWDRNWKTPADAGGKTIETHLNKMVEWMKKSYTPVGGLGTVTRYRNAWGFGVNFMVWNVSHDKRWTDEKGNFKPISEENTKFYMAANMVFGAYPAEFLNNDKQFVFTWQDDGYQQYNWDKPDPRPAGIHPNASRFITIRNEMQSIMLAPGNKLPFVAVTKGELLQKSDEALAKSYDKADEHEKKNIERIRKSIADLQKKHRNTLNQEAILRNMQLTMYSFDFTDPFEISKRDMELKRYYRVYQFPPSLIAKLGNPEPQWITIAMPYESKSSGNQLYEMYTAITQNLNYEYIYHYFFDPEKIKGKAYVASNADQLQARLDYYRKNYREALAAKPAEAAVNSNTWFADNFAGTSPGDKPRNWYFKTTSEHPVIVTPKNEKGNWVQLGYFNPVLPSLLKYPLPKDFAIDFDLVTDEGFTVRTGGSAMLTLNTRKVGNNGYENNNGPGQTLTINFVSGVQAEHDYRGALNIDLESAPSKNIQNFNEGAEARIPMREFSDVKRKIHVSVKVKNGVVGVFINGKELSNSLQYKLAYGDKCVTCGFEPNALINTVSWKATTGEDSGKFKVYLGNVVITRL